MKQNPVYKREARVAARSLKLPVLLTVFNAILCLVALLNMYFAVSQVKATATIEYVSFMDMYRFVASIEFALLILIVPSVTASAISGERERQTLELMLTTQMTPGQIVTGKLMSALSTLILLVCSSFPALMLVFVFGGITLPNLVKLVLCYGAAALLAGSLGLFFSAAIRRSVLSTVATYVTLTVLVGGTYLLNHFLYNISLNQYQSYGGDFSQAIGSEPSSGASFWSFLLNPAATFYAVIMGQTGSGNGVSALGNVFGVRTGRMCELLWIPVSLGLQIAIAALLLCLAIRFVSPTRRRK